MSLKNWYKLNNINTKRTPKKFPNKSEYSKLLLGIKMWHSSKNIEIENKYLNKILILLILNEITPNKDRIIKA